jgi:hypothetical protein
MSVLKYLIEELRDYVTVSNGKHGRKNVMVYENPTHREIRDASKDSYKDSVVRLGMNKSGVLHAWNGDTLHDDIGTAINDSWVLRFLLNTRTGIVDAYNSSNHENDPIIWDNYKKFAIPALEKAIPNLKHIQDQNGNVLWVKGGDQEDFKNKATEIVSNNDGFLEWLRSDSGAGDDFEKYYNLPNDDDHKWESIYELIRNQLTVWEKRQQ